MAFFKRRSRLPEAIAKGINESLIPSEAALERIKADNPIIEQAFEVYRTAPNGSRELGEAVRALANVGRQLMPKEAQHAYRFEFMTAHMQRTNTFGGHASDIADRPSTAYMALDYVDIAAYNIEVFKIPIE